MAVDLYFSQADVLSKVQPVPPGQKMNKIRSRTLVIEDILRKRRQKVSAYLNSCYLNK